MSELEHQGTMIRSVAIAFLAIASLFARVSIASAPFELPTGFRADNVVPNGAIKFPMFAAFDDAGQLYVAESSGLDLYQELQKLTRKCRVSLLQDRNGDGSFEDSRVFADQLVFPMGLAWRNGKLYVADPPDLITLEDTNRDGRADQRTVILSGFGHTDNGSLHGLTFGPDGWLYMTMGQPDGFKIVRADGRVIEGKSGALLRCQPDGSELEVVCRGFENLVEVVFLPTGEIIGTDNWFFLPQDGVRDALVHLIAGGVYPLDAHSAFERHSFFSGELLPPLQVYPAVAHSGLMRHSGRALPAAMHGSLFSAQFNTRKIVRHELSRHGSTFQSADHDFLSTADPDFHPSDVLEAPDGSILVIDTGSWYVQHCPAGRIRPAPAEGGIYRVRFTNSVAASPISVLPDTADQAAIRARTIGFERHKKHSAELSRLLSHEAPHVRLAAAEGLASCGTAEALSPIVDSLTKTNDPFLSHALFYALHKVADSAALHRLLKHEHPELRRAALVLLDQPPHQNLTASAALGCLRSSHAPLRQAALHAFQRHPEWQSIALNFIQELFAHDRANVPALRELAPAFLDVAEVRQLVFDTIANERKPTELRVSMLGMLAQSATWDEKSPPAALLSALRSTEPAVLSAALKALRPHHASSAAPELTALSHSTYSLPLRLEAARLLVRGASISEQTHELFKAALSPGNSAAVRLAAAEAMATASLSPPQLEAFIEKAHSDRLISPALIHAAAERAPDINSVADSLLRYFRGSIATGWRIPAATSNWLRTAFPERPEIEQLALANVQNAEQQVQGLTRLQPLLNGGDPNNGHQLFLGKLACASCHRVGKYGGLAGPDLTRVGAIRSGRDLIESVAFPSSTLAQGYETYQVTLADGETLTGIRARRLDDSFVLRDSSSAETRLDPSRIAKIERLPGSLMPDGLLSTLSQQEIRDLFAYLQSLK